MAVEFASLIIEAVSNFMSNNHAGAAIIGRQVLTDIETK